MAIGTSKRIFYGLWKDKRGLIGWMIVGSIFLVALWGPLLTPFDPLQQTLDSRLKPPGFQDAEGKHWLGTDHLGRDLASRIIYGSRISLAISFSALLLGAILGVTIGLVSGFFRGPIDAIFMRLTDIQMAFPFLLLIIAIVAVLGPSMLNTIIVLGITSWIIYARIVRSEVLTLREMEFVTAARALGCSRSHIILGHLLRNVKASSIVIATLELARMILMEGALSFLGLGVQPPTPSWGGIIADGRVYLYTGWWVATFPGLLMMVTILGINLVGDWLRDFRL